MKRQIKFKTMLAGICLAVITLSAAAQQTQTTPITYTKFLGAAEKNDTVTVGSVMSYRMGASKLPAALTAKMQFYYKWTVNGQSWAIKKNYAASPDNLDDVPADTLAKFAPRLNDYVKNSEVFLTIGTTTGTYQLETSILPVFNKTMLACPSDSSHTIVVVDKPTLDLATGDTLFCYPDFAAATNITIPGLQLTGIGSWVAEYTIDAYAFTDDANASSLASSTGSVTAGTPSMKTVTLSADILKSSLPTVSGVDIEKEGIKYVVKFTSISDRIMRKAYNVADLAAIAPTAQKSMVVWVMPAMQSRPLEHIKNL